MDFTKLLNWSNRARDLHMFLGDLLEGDRHLVVSPINANQSFEFRVRHDIESLMFASQTRLRHVADAGAKTSYKLDSFSKRFTRLAPFFEAGFLFDHTELDQSRLRSMFLLGQIFAAKGQPESLVKIALPEPGFSGVMKGNVKPLLRAFRLDGLKFLADACVFAFSEPKGATVLLVCNRPQPWQVGVIESAHEYLLGHLYESIRVSPKSDRRFP